MVLSLALYAIGALAYALNYDQASKSTDTLLLCFGITLFFGFRFWRVVEAKRSRPFNITGAILGLALTLLSIGAVWHPGSGRSFQYRGQVRWSGLWDNPNTFGMLMGVGLVLAVGQVIQSLKSGSKHPTSNIQHPTSKSGIWRWVTIVLSVCAAVVCGVGLVKSYSRGAWVGALCGTGYLAWQGVQSPKSKVQSPEFAAQPSTFNFQLSTGFQRNWLPISVILISALVLAFWNFRYTERLVARRAFSVGNVSDFSWRNRVAAYQGSLHMLASKPFLGFGWNHPQRIHDQYYRGPEVDEGAAIQLNDYFTLGTTLGIPALVCFASFIGLALTRNSEQPNRASRHASLVTARRLPRGCTRFAHRLLVRWWIVQAGNRRGVLDSVGAWKSGHG